MDFRAILHAGLFAALLAPAALGAPTETLRVTGMSITPEAVIDISDLVDLPEYPQWFIDLEFNAEPSGSFTSFRLTQSGGDGVFHDDNEWDITYPGYYPTPISFVTSIETATDVASIEISTRRLRSDVYRIIAFGDGDLISERDAELLAMEIASDELRPPTALVAQIRDDLMAIREFDPRMTAVQHKSEWSMGQIFIQLTEDAWNEWESGNLDSFDALCEEYEAIAYDKYPKHHDVIIYFTNRWNPVALTPLFLAHPGVIEGGPLYGVGDGSSIERIGTDPTEYIYNYAWGDCILGCINDHSWHFRVTDGEVSLEAEWGDPLTDPDFFPPLISNSSRGYLDGEFSGTFPSGDGTPGGDFIFTFTLTRRGDLNDDRAIDAADLVTLLSVTANPASFSHIQRLNADLNRDGEITAEDIDQLISALIGL